MRILITGAGGMLGQDVRAVALARGHEVAAPGRAELDVADPPAVEAAVGAVAPDALINCAAYTRVDDAEADAAGALRANALGPAVLATAAARAGAWLVHVSTDYVFDGARPAGPPYLESDPTGPRSVYGRTKLAGEEAVAAALPGAHTIARTAWLFGLTGPCFPRTILQAAETRPELRVVDDQIGCPTYTPHLAEALVDIAERRAPVGVVHLAAAGECSWFRFASELVAGAAARGLAAPGGAALAGVLACSTSEYPRPAPRPAYSVLRTEREDVPVLPPWTAGMAAFLTGHVAARRVSAGATG